MNRKLLACLLAMLIIVVVLMTCLFKASMTRSDENLARIDRKIEEAMDR